MRSFEERIAEIERRSEEIFKARKRRRKHILATCIPLTLCVGVCAAVVLSTTGASGPAPGGNALSQDKHMSLTCDIAKIQVSGAGVSQTYTDTADILRISEGLYTYAPQQLENNSALDETVRGEVLKDEDEASDNNTADTSSTGYTVTLVTHTGDSTEYYLRGNILENRRTGQTYTLTQTGLEELHALLGISRQGS